MRDSIPAAITSVATLQLASQASAANTLSDERPACDSANRWTVCAGGVQGSDESETEPRSSLKTSKGEGEWLFAISNGPAFCSTHRDALEPETEAALQMAVKQLCANEVKSASHVAV